jgi:hypothetical protein
MIRTFKVSLLFVLPIFFVTLFEKFYFLKEKIALKGFSQITWFVKQANPLNFNLDFPSGIEEFSLSLIMKIQLLMFQSFDIESISIVKTFIVLELLAIILSVYYFVTSIEVNKNNHTLIFIFLSTALVASNGLYSLGRFGAPFFLGQFYNFSEAARIIAFGFAVRGNINNSLFFNFLSLFIHPILGIIGFVSCAGFYIKYINLKSISISIIGGVFFLIWMYANLPQGIEKVPDLLAIMANKQFNLHFFPSEIGLYSFLHWESTTPILLLTLIYYLLTDRRFSVAVNLLLALTALGLVISQFSNNYQLIQLNLQRASSFAAFLMFSEILVGLPKHFRESKLSCRFVILALGFVFVWSLFFDLNIFKYYFVFIFTSVLVFMRLKIKKAIFINSILICYIYFIGFENFYLYPTQFQNYFLLNWAGLLIAMTLVFLGLYKKHKYFFALSILVLSINWSLDKIIKYDSSLSRAYLDAQIWAKNNTKPNALFSPPPTIFYGWREFSERPSIGNFREWALTSWLYNRNLNNYKRGLEIAEIYSNYGRFPIKEVNFKKGGWTKEFDSFYESQNYEYYKNIMDNLGIDFFVFKKVNQNLNENFNIVYENKYFVISTLKLLHKTK